VYPESFESIRNIQACVQILVEFHKKTGGTGGEYIDTGKERWVHSAVRRFLVWGF